MKKILFAVLALVLVITLAGCDKKSDLKKLVCTYETDTEYTTIEWTRAEIKTIMSLTFDDEEIAASNVGAFKTNKNVASVQQDGNVVLVTTVEKNKEKKTYDGAKKAYESQGYTCK